MLQYDLTIAQGCSSVSHKLELFDLMVNLVFQDLCSLCTNFIISELWTENFLAYQVSATLFLAQVSLDSVLKTIDHLSCLPFEEVLAY